ncbi:MAG: phosphoenolpyruvate carboxykinase (ATP) [Planctomycetota bacterium]
MESSVDLNQYGIDVGNIRRNIPAAAMYEHAVLFDQAKITSSGALATDSASKKGRSPKDKRVVREPSSESDVWWGDVNIEFSQDSFARSREIAIKYLNSCERLYVVDGYAGWDREHRIKVRVICSRPYHALFMHNMLIRPNDKELTTFGEPDYVIYNAGCQNADTNVPGVETPTSVALDFGRGEFVILGTQYAGEMKKGVFTIMNYLMPKRGILSMHCSANEGPYGDVTLFFGLSGTGKTTLSADPERELIGDDEHCWSDKGVFNIEGGCYAKCIGLNARDEPEIFAAIRYGAVLENVTVQPRTRKVDYMDESKTENTRASYPIEHIPHARIPCLGAHPKNIIFLTCDAFGVLPPVAKLTPEQAMYHFISGYTAKVAGTEVGVTDPQATFSACFGAPFLVWHPAKYAELLAAKMRETKADAWLISTGWIRGSHGVGERISLKHTRAIIDAVHNGVLADTPMVEDPVFGLHVPKKVDHVPKEILTPRTAWADKAAFDATAKKLARLFAENFKQFEAEASPEIKAAGPRLELEAAKAAPVEASPAEA